LPVMLCGCRGRRGAGEKAWLRVPRGTEEEPQHPSCPRFRRLFYGSVEVAFVGLRVCVLGQRGDGVSASS